MQAYQPCHEPFLRYCSALAYSKMDTEDLVQDVLLSAYKQFEKIKKKGELLHYLIRAARNRSVSIWRKGRNKAELLEKHQERMYSQGITPDTLMEIHLLYAALERLPASQREALTLFEISGFSMREIAQIQGSSESAVKTKVSRGRTKLRRILEPNEVKSTSTAFEVLRTIAL